MNAEHDREWREKSFRRRSVGTLCDALIAVVVIAGVLVAVPALAQSTEPAMQFLWAQNTVSGLNRADKAVNVAVDASRNLYVLTAPDGVVWKFIWTDSGYMTPTKIAQVSLPSSCCTQLIGLAVDARGNVFVDDVVGHSLVEVPFKNGSYGAVSTILNFANASVVALAVNTAGDLYVADSDNSGEVFKLVQPSPGEIPEFILIARGLNSYAANPGAVSPSGVAFDASGNLYVGMFASESVPTDGAVIEFARSSTSPLATVSPATRFPPRNSTATSPL